MRRFLVAVLVVVLLACGAWFEQAEAADGSLSGHPLSHCRDDRERLCSASGRASGNAQFNCMLRQQAKIKNAVCRSWYGGLSACRKSAASLCPSRVNKVRDVWNCLLGAKRSKISPQCKASYFYAKEVATKDLRPYA
ncbi:uncharacterized protein Tco025E_04791 [Trypanosoma conorhini]|uniref:Uncharacterized protein n=1 Tax=Trypanosoma conorhini TaxID=83891 RepID=A0A422PIM6_9TRYP|nr:uncharacterized protein Tco025E_04791 [Trypanosoma conorhini]RNF17556.1 hypothetical protein Tco025E_04791 [Trypanosoma conorhini]